MRLSLKPNVSSGNCSIVTLFINFTDYISTEYCDFYKTEFSFRHKKIRELILLRHSYSPAIVNLS